MTDLPNDIESLKTLIHRLLEKIAQLEAENAELRRRLGLDSSNSHKPPSSDGLGKKPIKPGLPKDKNSTNGGQPGHKGNPLKRVAKPDHVKIHLPQQYQCCGRQFSVDEAHHVVGSRQIFDLPEPRLEVTEHRVAQIGWCCIDDVIVLNYALNETFGKKYEWCKMWFSSSHKKWSYLP